MYLFKRYFQVERGGIENSFVSLAVDSNDHRGEDDVSSNNYPSSVALN